MSPSPDNAAAASAPPCASPTPASDPHAWFTREVHAHDGLLKSWLHRQFSSLRDIEDLVQDSYLRVWKSPTRDEIHSATALFFRVALIRRDHCSPITAVSDLSALETA